MAEPHAAAHRADGRARRWLDAGHGAPVAVNVSARGPLGANVPATVADGLVRAGGTGALLGVEITEITVMADPVSRLRVRAAIDDLGPGYPSMA